MLSQLRCMAWLKNQDREDPVSDVPIRDSPDEERGPRWPFDLLGLRYVTTYTSIRQNTSQQSTVFNVC